MLGRIFVGIVVVQVFWLAKVEAAPVLITTFNSSSGRTVIQYYSYKGAPCGVGLHCDFDGALTVPPGFDQAEVFLSGFELQLASRADAVSQAYAVANKKIYNAPAGTLEVHVGAGLGTRTNQQFSYTVTFVVILTGNNVAQFTRAPIVGCAGVGSCKMSETFPGAIPANMDYIGLATYQLSLGSHAGPIMVNTLSGHPDTYSITTSGASIDLQCVLRGARPQKMFCEWGTKLIAFDRSEMEKSPSPLYPQHTFLSFGSSARVAWSEHVTNPAHHPISGFLDALEGITFSYQIPPYVGSPQYPVWMIEDSATNFRIDPAANDTAITDYGIFLGTLFGAFHAKTFGYQSSRVFGFLR